MADRFEVTLGDQNFSVDTFPAQGNSRSFTVGSIPLSCTIRRVGEPNCADVRYFVQAPTGVDIPDQELCTPAEFYASLSDPEMPGHARFVLGRWSRSAAEAE